MHVLIMCKYRDSSINMQEKLQKNTEKTTKGCVFTQKGQKRPELTHFIDRVNSFHESS